MSDDPKIGTARWWSEQPFGVRGPVDATLRLLEQGEISRSKAREMLAWCDKTRFGTARLKMCGAQPEAPWEKLNWSDE